MHSFSRQFDLNERKSGPSLRFLEAFEASIECRLTTSDEVKKRLELVVENTKRKNLN